MTLRRWAALGLVVTALAGCEDRVVHAFSAYRYDAVGQCLEKASTIDVVEGPDPGRCEALRCWFSPATEDGGLLTAYVTDAACDAPPGYREGTNDPPGTLCAAALAAYGEPRCP